MSNQILHLVDKLNNVDMASVDGVAPDFTGNIALPGRGDGQLGLRVTYRQQEAVEFSDTSVGTLKGGVFQLVQTKAGSTIAPAKGLLAWWDPTQTDGDFVVTPDIPTGSSLLAGVYLNAPTKGNYTIIQVHGLVDVQTVATLDTTGAVGQVGVAATGSKVDTDAASTDILLSIYKTFVGVFQTAPGNDGFHELFLTEAVARY
jgi:hypothetical protein